MDQDHVQGIGTACTRVQRSQRYKHHPLYDPQRDKTIPADRTVTYTRIVVDYQPPKDDLNRVCITVDGKLINYIYELTNRTAGLTSSKMLWNSTISTPGASFCTADVKNFCLETPMERYEYMHIHIKLIPKEIIDLYNLRNKVKGDYIYMDIRAGMYGLPQAGCLANNLLRNNIAKYG